MNITILTTIFPRSKNDLRGIFIGTLAKKLSEEKSISLRVIAPSGKDGLLWEAWGKLSVKRFQYWYPRRKQSLAYGESNTLSTITSNLFRLPQLPAYCVAFFLNTVKVWRTTDVFHCHWTFSAIFPIFINMFAIKKKKPIIVSCWGGDLLLLPGVFNRYILRNVTAMTFASPLKKLNRYEKKFGKNIAEYVNNHTPLGAFEIYAPLDEKRFKVSDTNIKKKMGIESKKTVLWLSRLDWSKNPVTAVDVMHHLTVLRDDVCMVLIGFGPLENDVKSRIVDSGLEKCVLYLGSKSNVMDYYHLADLYLTTNCDCNIWSTTITEAMMMECPIVLTNVGYTSKVFTDEYDAKLVPFDNPKKIALTIHQLLDDKDKMKKLAVNAKKTLQKYRRYDGQAIEDHIRLYKEVIQSLR